MLSRSSRVVSFKFANGERRRGAALGGCLGGRRLRVIWEGCGTDMRVMWDIDLVRSGDVEMVVMVDLVLKHSHLAVIFVYVG